MINITGSASTVNFDVTGLGISWHEVLTSSVTMTYEAGYVVSYAGAGHAMLTLPATAPQFSVIQIVGNGASGWQIVQNTGQQIKFGVASTSLGGSGYLQSTDGGDCIELICVTANTTWRVVNSQGNITYV